MIQKIKQSIALTTPKLIKPVAKRPEAGRKVLNDNMLSKTLLALAVLATPLSQSCIKDEQLPVYEETFVTETPIKQINNTNSAYDKTNLFAQKLGLFKNVTDKINDVNVLYFKDEAGNEFYFQPVNLKRNKITSKHIHVFPDHTGREYKVDLTSYDNGLKMERTSNEGIVTTSYFEFDNESEIVKCIDENGIVSEFVKQDDGTIIQRFTDGTCITYGEIDNVDEMTSEIFFKPSVNEWVEDDADVLNK